MRVVVVGSALVALASLSCGTSNDLPACETCGEAAPGDAGARACTPMSCAALGCYGGPVADGCGKWMRCACQAPLHCGGPAGDHVCQPLAYQPVCSAAGFCWETPLPAPGYGLLAGTGANDVWRGLDAGLVLRWDGTTWTWSPSPARGNVVGIRAAAPDDVTVVTHLGEVIHWNGAAWSLVGGATPHLFSSAWLSAPDDGWAVTCYAGLCYRSGDLTSEHETFHWDGSGWTQVTNPITTPPGVQEPPDLFTVAGTAKDDVWAGGMYGDAIHWDGSSWTQLATPGTALINDLSVLGPNDIWGSGQEIVIHWDGTSWATPTFGPSAKPVSGAIYARAADDLWAFDVSSIAHGDGKTFDDTPVPAELQGAGIEFASAWGSAPNDVWFAGAALMHWDGGAWGLPFPVAPRWTLIAAACANGSDDVWLATDDGLVHWDGSSWLAEESSDRLTLTDLWDVACLAKDDVWAVGANGVTVHYDGTRWSRVATGSDSSLMAVWALGPNDVYAAGPSTMVHWDGAAWSDFPLPEPNIGVRTITGTADDDLWINGPDPLHVEHWDGHAWSKIATPTSGAANELHAIARDDVWGVVSTPKMNAPGGDATIVHWDGAAWSRVTNPYENGTGLVSVFGRTSDDVWAVGGAGVGSGVLHWDGAAWSEVDATLERPVTFTAVTTSAEGDVWLVGAFGDVAHRKPR